MKFESMPTAPQEKPAEQPVAPDESQRVEDEAKARKMAEAEDPLRTEANKLRELAEHPAISSNQKNQLESRADTFDKGADRAGNLEGDIYDVRKENPNLTEKEAIRNIQSEPEPEKGEVTENG